VKIQFVNESKESASVLVLTLILAVILGATLGSYLVLVRSQTVLGAQSQAWNSALTLAEAGIEDGMAQINITYGQLLAPTNYLSSITTNWGALAGGVYSRSNTLISGSYSASLLPTNPGPTITATGYTSVVFVGKRVARIVQVTTAPLPTFANGIAALSAVTTKGNKLTIDSYDSADPAHSTNGMYNAATRKAGGDVADLAGNVNIQNANIYGHLKLGPTATYTINSGTVGDLNWAGPGVEPGWVANDYNIAPADVAVPYNSGFSVPVNNNNATNTYPLTTGNYYVSGDFVMSQNETMVVSGNVKLYVTGNVTMKSQNAFYINISPGSSLTLYVGTASGSAVSTKLTQVNLTGNAANFSYYGLPSNKSLVWAGNNAFIGTVYAPQADFTCGGGGNNTFDYQGACLVSTVWMNGHFNFHYDENLKRSGPVSGFTVTSWKEL
jgi:hypothetical protein